MYKINNMNNKTICGFIFLFGLVGALAHCYVFPGDATDKQLFNTLIVGIIFGFTGISLLCLGKRKVVKN
jgi:hypothetical protein